MAAKPLLIFVAKWLIVPILFGLLGYYIIGPMVNASPATKAAPSQPVEPESVSPEPLSSKKITGEPSVEVIVEKPKKSQKIRSSSKRRATEPPKSQEPAPVEPAPEPEPSSPAESDGA